MKLFKWLNDNKQWIFSGIGVFILSGFIGFMFMTNRNKNGAQIQEGSDNIQAGRDIIIVNPAPKGNDSEVQNVGKKNNSSLVFTIHKKGWLHLKEQGRVYEFTLSNPTKGLAIVESIAIDVLDVIEDRYPEIEAMIADFKYKVSLDPKFRGRIVFAEGFKYASGEVDRFSILLKSSSDGYDYFFRFVIKWYDPSAKQSEELFSDIFIARYPSPEDGFYENGDPAYRRKFEEHIERVWNRKKELMAE